MPYNASKILGDNVRYSSPNSNKIKNMSSNPTTTNQGGFIGGLGYVFNKFGLNFVRSFEGIWDYAAGGIADLFGADKWAERQFANDWLNYNHADEWYNPGEGWKVAGDIGGGIGSMGPSLVALAAAGAMTYFSGGSAAPAAIALVKAAGMTGLGLSAAGGATKEAYEESGELGAKQYGYGALVGATELAMEKVTAGIGVGTGRLYKNIGSNVAKNTAKTVSKSLIKNGAVKVAAKLGADFASEAFEEGFSEFISPYYKRLTYDPNAENASIQEISYAALIGGMSGLLMTGSAGAINTTSNYISGNKAVNADSASKIIETALKYADYENNNSTGYEAMSKLQEVLAAYDKSVANNGVTNNAYQKMLIGQMQKLNTLAQISPFAERSAEKVLSDAEGVAKYLNENSYTNSKGQPFTVSDLTAGIDMTDTTSKEGRKRYLKSLRKAMSSNPDLAFAIAVDATGGIFMDAKAISEGALSGRQFNSSAELQEFVEKSNDKDVEALSKILKTDIRSGDVDAVNKAILLAKENGIQDILDAKAQNPKKIPHRYNSNHKDGATRYSTEDGRVNFAIIKRDGKYIVYDYMTESSAEFPSLQKLNAFLADINKDISENGTKNIGIDRLSVDENVKAENTENITTEKTSEITRKVFKLASKVEGYAKLNENNKRTVRGVMRQALAHGVSEDVAVDIASVAARSGAKIRFNKEACRVTKKDGTIAYANGKYSKTTDTITLNPDAKNKIDVIFLHELLHNMVAAKSGKRTYAKLAKMAKARMSKTDREALEDRYASYNITDKKVIAEEITTHYGETLTNRAFIKALVAEDASIIERIVDFFTKAKSDYAGSEKLSRSAKKFLRAYKKMFAEFSAKNQNTNAYGEAIKWKAEDDTDIRYALIGKTEDGRGIYRSNYPKNTPKAQKQKDIIDLVQNVWSKKPIKLNLIVDGKTVPIEASFNPELTERSDLSKIAFGNRKGTNSEKRITLDLSSDLYQIAEESHHVGSKTETGKDNPAHFGVSEWHYFLTNLVFVEDDGTNVDCYMNIDVKQNDIGHWFYSFAIEKGTAPRTLLAGVTEESATVPDNSITENAEKINPSDKNSSDRLSLPDEAVNSPTLENVAKEREQYKPGPKDKFFTAWDNFQIEAVDETYGIQKYLIKNGGVARADVEALVQLARASRVRANEMIGSSQYDLFTQKKLGDGLDKIYKPINDEGEEYVGKFEDYLLHLLNIDRMTLHERTQAEYDAIALELLEINEQIEAKKKRIEYLANHKQKQKVKTARAELKELKAKRKALNKKLAANPVLDDKPVFGENAERAQAITAEESRKIAEQYEAKYPQFKETRDKLYAFLQNLQNMRVEAGLVSQKSANRMAKLYPHYVPSMRDTSYGGTSAVYGDRNLAVSSTIKSAKGGGQDILSIEKSIADQVIRTVEAIDVNRILKAVYDAAVKSGDNVYVRIEDTENTSETQDTEYNKRYSSIELRPTNNQITFFIDGKQTTMKVSKEIYLGFKGLTNSSLDGGVIMQRLAKLNKAFKMGVTTLNPLFGIRNVVRDLQDAGLNSKHPKLFLKNLPLAINDMIHNSEEWQLYRAMGGFSSTVYENGEIRSSGKRGFEAFEKIFDGSKNTPEQIFKKLKKSGKNLFRLITMANEALEQMTRFAEFKASLAAGDSAEIALNNSAEVTTNFGRHGRLTKIANSTIMPFLNASVQGFDKIFRNMRDAIGAGDAEKIAKALAQLLLKAMLIGVVPMLLNIFMYGGDDDYESLRDDLKESYFLIRISEGKFIRIPRGRLAGVIGGAFNRSYVAAKGGDPDIKGYLGDVVSQVTPVENMSRTIFAPFKDVSTNTTWYGGEIEGREFENVAPGERYDESTSSIAIAIGKALNYSPKKIHYLLDQYSGVIGDLVLPATTKKAEKGFWSGNFVTDSATSNRLSSDFYKFYDEVKYAKSAGDDTAIYQLKHLNKVRDAVSELRKEKEAIENDASLSDKEKRAEVRAVQILINQLYDTALKDYPAYTRAVEQTASIPDEKLRHVATTKLMYGAEAALEVYNKDVHEKASLISKANISFDDYYDYYFTVKSIEADVDKNGNPVDGSRRKKVVSAISKMKLRNEQKLLLICASGFSVADGDIKGMSKKKAKTALLKYILSLKISVEEREKLAKMCGFEAKNGRIYIKK